MKHFILHYLLLFLLILTISLYANDCFSQIQTKTNFKSIENIESFPNELDYTLNRLEITLNGKVKSITIITHSPDYSCDTNETIYKKGYFERNFYETDCRIDSISYFFNTDLQIYKIIFKNLNIFLKNYEDRNQTEYYFENGLIYSKIYINNGLIMNETSYEYNSNKQIIKIKNFDKRHSFSNIHLFEYGHKNLLIKNENYEFYELSDKNPQLHNGVEFVYDSLSNLIEKKWENYYIDYYNYDTLGNIIEKVYAPKSKEGKSYNHLTAGFEYDKNNKLTKKYFIHNSNKLDSEYLYCYDEQGRIIELKRFSIDEDTVLKFHVKYEYDENGNIITIESLVDQIGHGDNCELFKKKIISYDTHGNIAEEIYFSGVDFEMKIFKYVYIYDSNGNWIKREVYQIENQDKLERKKIIDRIIEYY